MVLYSIYPRMKNSVMFRGNAVKFATYLGKRSENKSSECGFPDNNFVNFVA